MKKDKKLSAKKTGIIIWVIVISAMLLGIISGAAYINKNSVKRVVSVMSGGGIAFSSNYMLLSAPNSPFITKKMSFPANSETTPLNITVCNYVQNDPSRVNENKIDYSMTFRLLDEQDSVITERRSDFSIDGAVFSDGVYTVSGQTLSGGTKNTNRYTVTVPKAFVDEKIKIEAAAIPLDTSMPAVNNNVLGRIFSFSCEDSAKMTWAGSFVETTVDNYDGFNYILKGQGKGTITLKWDTSQLEINQYFIVNNRDNGSVTQTSNDTIQIKVDSTVTDRYDIQFYKVKNGVYNDMASVNGYITIDFVEDTSSE